MIRRGPGWRIILPHYFKFATFPGSQKVTRIDEKLLQKDRIVFFKNIYATLLIKGTITNLTHKITENNGTTTFKNKVAKAILNDEYKVC